MDIARGWDLAAAGYESYYVPRFAPWVDTAVRAITGALPDGPILVPCCGTFPELDALVKSFPDREIVGIDLSEGMVRLARERAAGLPRVRVVQGDASSLDDHRCAAVVSVFGLQQLPEPDAALRSWASTLRPGGVLSVVFWPGNIETDGPFSLLSKVLRAHVPAGDRSWEERLTVPGVVVDEDVAHPMSHPSAEEFFTAHTESGPLRPLADDRGPEFVARLREEFLRLAPSGEWRHRPRARHIVARSTPKQSLAPQQQTW
ncbi:class I SAM-dependent methyltransferase [Allokutzneria albata]|uniref:Methyltransferase domain-containing protein n=1 Tax=Allokutzneria albata TaxID=211114 RepID=A0A1G9Y247_ALLAB|nr:class I SAM-dependent methyltransferase [Allokutzneria albata]SDN03162.1 Methyltransferase domain-containing protein [Allokutzneria albata]